jgi:hypothetical protein
MRRCRAMDALQDPEPTPPDPALPEPMPPDPRVRPVPPVPPSWPPASGVIPPSRVPPTPASAAMPVGLFGAEGSTVCPPDIDVPRPPAGVFELS